MPSPASSTSSRRRTTKASSSRLVGFNSHNNDSAPRSPSPQTRASRRGPATSPMDKLQLQLDRRREQRRRPRQFHLYLGYQPKTASCPVIAISVPACCSRIRREEVPTGTSSWADRGIPTFSPRAAQRHGQGGFSVSDNQFVTAAGAPLRRRRRSSTRSNTSSCHGNSTAQRGPDRPLRLE